MKQPTIDELIARRVDLITLCEFAKNRYIRSLLHYKLKSVNRDLYTITKNTIYL